MKQQKLILVDVDGVLVDWNNGFNNYMISNGYVNTGSLSYNLNERYDVTEDKIWGLVHAFNKSDELLTLQSLRDAELYIDKLHNEHGYQFHAITSMGQDPTGMRLREQNLHELFSPSAFRDITFVELNKSKHAELEPYRDSGLIWVEDKFANALIGHELGLQSVLIEHDYNEHHFHPGIKHVTTWKEVYDIILS